MSVAAIVPAAGLGRRFNTKPNKPYAKLNGVPLLVHTLRVLEANRSIRWIIPVVRRAEISRVGRIIRDYCITKAKTATVGGASRAESVFKGFQQVSSDAKWVLIHDGARPCISPGLIQKTLRVGKQSGAAVCALPAHLTVKSVNRKRVVVSTLNRDKLWLAQTPQVFRRDWLFKSLKRSRNRLSKFPDDASVVEAAGFPVSVVVGEKWNLKITTKDDLVLAEAILKKRS